MQATLVTTLPKTRSRVRYVYLYRPLLYAVGGYTKLRTTLTMEQNLSALPQGLGAIINLRSPRSSHIF